MAMIPTEAKEKLRFLATLDVDAAIAQGSRLSRTSQTTLFHLIASEMQGTIKDLMKRLARAEAARDRALRRIRRVNSGPHEL